MIVGGNRYDLENGMKNTWKIKHRTENLSYKRKLSCIWADVSLLYK